MILDELIDKFKNFPVKEILIEAINENTEAIEDKNAEQLQRGEQPSGAPITPEYSETTVRYKRLRNMPFDRVTLFETGDFYRGIQARADGDFLTIEGTDIKTSKLEAKYGEILGLSEDSIKEISQDVIVPEMRDKIDKYLNL